MSDDYKIVAYTPERKEEVLQLASYVWSPDPELCVSYLKWKYHDNPYMVAPVFYLAMHDGRAVAMRGLFTSRWESNGNFFELPCFGDSAALPEHRGRGLMGLITRSALDDIGSERPKYALSLSAGAFTRRAFVENGAVRLDLPVTYTRRMEPADIASSYTLSENCLDSVSGSVQVAPSVWIEERPRPQAMGRLIMRIPRDGRIRHVRDAAYFSWRFGNPLSRYWFLYCATGDELSGYLVMQMSRKKRELVNIIDYEALDRDVALQLLHSAVAVSGGSQLTIWPDTSERMHSGTIYDLGFAAFRDSRVHCMLVGSTCRTQPQAEWELGCRQLCDPRNWDMRMIYSDNY